MDTYYQEIARAVTEVCPSRFSLGKVVADLGDATGTVRYDCEVNGAAIEGLLSETSRDYQVYKALKEIRTQMTVPGQAPWSRCTFTLFPDGKFKFDVEYDD